jgi:hypothetical protein
MAKLRKSKEARDPVKSSIRTLEGSTPAQYLSVVSAFEKMIKGRGIKKATRSDVERFVLDPMASIWVRRRRLSALRRAYKALQSPDPTEDISVPRPSVSGRREVVKTQLLKLGYRKQKLGALTWSDLITRVLDAQGAERDVLLMMLRSTFSGRDAFADVIRRSKERVFPR